MEKKILLLNDKRESLLSVSFTLRCAQYSTLLFNDPEELVNWAKIYCDSVCTCLLLNGCSHVAVLNRLLRLLAFCDLDLRILVVGDSLPQQVQDLAEITPQISCCAQADLIAELERFNRSQQQPTN